MNIQIKPKCKNCGKELEAGDINDSYPTPSELKPGLIVSLQVETCNCIRKEEYQNGYDRGFDDGLYGDERNYEDD